MMFHMRSGFRLVLIISFLVVLPRIAAAFGGDGHRIVAALAERRLTPAAKAEVVRLLGNATLVDVANWADEVRQTRKETSPWHYVDIPLEKDTFDEARDGRGGDNIIEQIDRLTEVLQDVTRARDERVEALKFIVHFVGDMHQPLHCAERNKDKGGNTRLVFFLGERKAVPLHRVWDSSILNQWQGGTKLNVFAAGVDSRIKPLDAKKWAEGTTRQWAQEAHKVARDHVYRGVPEDGPPPKIAQDYVQRNRPVLEIQLQRAGIRLAAFLNRTLGRGATTKPTRAD